MSEVKVNKISPRTNCGTTTLGDSGDSFVIPSGVTITNNGTQTGFGRSGTVDWDTTAKTAAFTAVSGNGYFVNTTSGAITVTLPASPSAGDIVAVKDYAATAATNNITIARNGSNIGGVADDLVIDTDEASKSFVYVDATQGWLVVNDATASGRTISFVAATGGTVVTCGDFKTHIFTSPGTFCVSCAGNPAGSDTVDYFVVAGGGGGGPSASDAGGGGGGAGFRLSNSVGCVPSPTNSPLENSTGLPVTAQGYPITVGGGGAAVTAGSNSIFSTITSAGGGRGLGPSSGSGGATVGQGGSGGGGGANNSANVGGNGNTPPVSPPQGNPGGASIPNSGLSRGSAAGGGGAGAVGSNATSAGGGSGGPGATGSYLSDDFVGPTAPSYGTSGPVCGARYFAGGGGGNTHNGVNKGSGGTGGGGAAGSAGTTNTGGAGGGGSPGGGTPKAGGSGIVMIRYKFQ